MNDRLLWRLWKPTDIYLWSYGPFHNQAYDSRKFYLQTYSSTDLIKSSCDEKELFTSKIKCLKGGHIVIRVLCPRKKNDSIQQFNLNEIKDISLAQTIDH